MASKSRSPFAAMFSALVVAAALAAAAVPAGAQTATPSDQNRALNLSAYVELLRGDIRVQKIAIISEVMQFTEQDGKVFWPIYRDYDAEMSKLGDERVDLIADYAKNFDNVTDDIADRLAKKALDLESRRQAVKAKFYERVRDVLKPKTAMRALQVEHQLLLLTDLQIAASLPIVAK